MHQNRCLLRRETTNDLKSPEKPIKKCIGFSYNGAKLFNKLPCKVRENLNPSTFKSQIKTWIWENILSY